VRWPTVEEENHESNFQRKVFRMAVFLAALLATCMFARGANAQFSAFEGKFTLPYETHWGKAVLPAGNYVLTFTNDNTQPKLMIRDAKSLLFVRTSAPTFGTTVPRVPARWSSALKEHTALFNRSESLNSARSSFMSVHLHKRARGKKRAKRRLSRWSLLRSSGQGMRRWSVWMGGQSVSQLDCAPYITEEYLQFTTFRKCWQQ